nr:hypothetical protein [Natronolimnohabitans innermongolicus]
MANSDDANRVLASCVECSSVYAARQWPDGEIQAIGNDGCSCGSTDFELVQTVDESSAGETGAE